MRKDDPLFRCADHIHRLLSHYRERISDDFALAVERLRSAQGYVSEAWERIEKARSHNWHLAARALQSEMFYAARSLQGEVSQFVQLEHQHRGNSPVTPTL